MGELRGRGDQPPEQPDKPADADPPWNATKDGSKLWRVIRASDDMFAPPGEFRPDRSRLKYEKPSPDDRPAERPPTGEELSETDGPNRTLLDSNEVIDYVADLRSRSDNVAAELDPEKAERMIMMVISDDGVDDLSSSERIGLEMILIAGFVTDAGFDAAGLETFLEKARAFGNALLA